MRRTLALLLLALAAVVIGDVVMAARLLIAWRSR